MDEQTRKHFDNLQSKDPESRYQSFQWLIKLTQKPVDWAYEVWNDLLLMLEAGDNHQRTIAAQLLSGLAKSDPEERMVKDLDKLMAVTHDKRFVTARHSLQSLWKVGTASNGIQKELLNKLSKRFKEAKHEKNCTLIRYDILEVLRRIYNQLPGEELKKIAIELIGLEEDPKYVKKYTGLWKDLMKMEE